MSEKITMASELNLQNLGVFISSLPDNLFLNIKNECLDFINKKVMISGLTARGVAKHFYLDESVDQLCKFLTPIISEYIKQYEFFKDFNILSRSVPLAFTKPWFNIQKKSEFIPSHIHEGLLSYTIWIQLPKVSKVEERRFDGCFEFDYCNIVGLIRRHRIILDKSYEGKMILFPGNLPHCVYPFYDSDEIRISVSGNINLNNS
jgi:hypothetical protein